MILPPIGFGTYPQKTELLQSVPAALDAGFRMVDTSDNYANEEFVGRGLAAAGEVARDVVVMTKFSQPRRTHGLRRCFEESREKLGGRIDVYLLHWPYPYLSDIQWREMERLYADGQCGAIGVCNFEREHLESLLARCRIKPMVNQIERHPLFQQRETVEYCRQQGIRVISYSPFGRGDASLMTHPVLMEIAARHGKSVAQVILRWNVEHGDIPIPSARSAEHIHENFDVADFVLSIDEINAIDGLDSGHRVRFDPKTRFSAKDRKRFLVARFKCWLKSLGLERSGGVT